jgi:hypothetical protein
MNEQEQLLEVLKTVCETAATGNKRWYLNGQLHRVDGPAVEYTNGTKWWFLNGQLHRIDGPAFDDARGTKCWFLHGQELTEEEFNQNITRLIR